MAFLDWISRRTNAKRDALAAPQKMTPDRLNPAPQSHRTPDEIIAGERLPNLERGMPEAQTANGNPISWNGETKLPGGSYLHRGSSAEGFHSAMERPQDYFKPRQWGAAFPTADEAMDSALRSPEPANDVTAAPNEQHQVPSRTESRGGWER